MCPQTSGLLHAFLHDSWTLPWKQRPHSPSHRWLHSSVFPHGLLQYIQVSSPVTVTSRNTHKVMHKKLCLLYIFNLFACQKNTLSAKVGFLKDKSFEIILELSMHIPY